jgi:hypothetical protein
MVHDAANEAISRLQEELVHSEAYSVDTELVQSMIEDVISELTSASIDPKLVEAAQMKMQARAHKRAQSVETSVRLAIGCLFFMNSVQKDRCSS